MELFSIVKKKEIEIIVMASIYMLPSNPKDFKELCDIVKKIKKCFFSFLKISIPKVTMI